MNNEANQNNNNDNQAQSIPNNNEQDYLVDQEARISHINESAVEVFNPPPIVESLSLDIQVRQPQNVQEVMSSQQNPSNIRFQPVRVGSLTQSIELRVNDRKSVVIMAMKSQMKQFLVFFSLMIVIIVSLTVKNRCDEPNLTSYLVLTVIQLFITCLNHGKQSYDMMGILRELIHRGETANIDFSPQELFTPSSFQEAYYQRHPGVKYSRFGYLVFYLVVFVYGNVVTFTNLQNHECLLGARETNFVWGMIFVSLIIGYFFIGLPFLFFLTYLIVAPFLIMQRGEMGSRVNPILQQLEIKRLDTVNLLPDSTCSICLVDFKKLDEVISLPCDERHVFHKQCIHDWLKVNLLCPLCKQRVQPKQLQPQTIENPNSDVQA